MIRLSTLPANISRILPKATVAVLTGMLLVGLLTPLYSDEVGWRLQERAGIDGLDKLYSEQCGPNTLAVPPWFMMPARWYSAFFNTAWPDPLAVRLSGVAYALMWVVLLLMLVRRVTEDPLRREWLTMLGCGLMGLGVLPWLLVWSRPEQPIILAATASVLLALPPRGQQSTRWWVPVAILVLATIAMAYHFKTLVLLPLFITAMLVSMPPRRGWKVQLPCLIALLAMSAVSSRYWFGRMACPGDPVMAAEHAKQSLGLQLLTSGGWVMAPLRLLANYNLPAYVIQGAPDVTPMSSWLPPYLVSRSTGIGWAVALIELWLVGFVLAVWAMVAALVKRRLDGAMVLAWVTLACMSAWCVSQVVRNSYEASFVLPLLIVMMVLALSRTNQPAALLRVLARIAPLVGALLPVSAIAVLAIYGPSLAQTAGQSGYLPGRPYSVGLAHYSTLRRQIERAAAACGITPASHPARLLIDDVTYFTFMRSPLPEHKTSVLEPRFSGSLSDPLAYLAERHSSGVILACSALPPALRARAHADGDFCCIGPDQWHAPPPQPLR